MNNLINPNDLPIIACVDILVIKRLQVLKLDFLPADSHDIPTLFERLFTDADLVTRKLCQNWWKYTFDAPLNPVYILPSIKHIHDLNADGRLVAFGDYLIAMARCGLMTWQPAQLSFPVDVASKGELTT